MEIQAYPSRVDDPASKKFEAFSYLPPMTDEQLQKQLDYLVAQDLDCVVEHVEPARASETYWYMWKLPYFGNRDRAALNAAIAECHQANPGHHVRVSGIDKKRQTVRFSLVVHRG